MHLLAVRTSLFSIVFSIVHVACFQWLLYFNSSCFEFFGNLYAG